MDHLFDKVASFELLARIAMAANEARDASALLHAAPQLVCEVTGWPLGCVCAPDDGKTAQPTITGWYASDALPGFNLLDFQRAADAQCKRKEDLLNRVLTNGTPAWDGELAGFGSPLADPARKAGLAAGYAFPVGRPGNTVAVLAFYAVEFREPSCILLPAMAEVGRQLACAVTRCKERAGLVADVQRARAVLERAADAFIGINRDGRITDWNRSAAAMFGWSRTEALGRTLAETILPARYQKDHHAGLARVVAADAEVSGKPRTLCGVDRHGREFPLEITLWSFQQGADWRCYASIRDTSDREASRKQLEQRACSDPLTGLPNRVEVLKQLERLLRRPIADSPSLAVLFVDLDHFKRINDGIGHDAGDAVLKAVAGRLRQAVRGADMVARIGGDEFVIVCPDLAGPQEAAQMAQRVQASLTNPVHVAGRSVTLTASIGVAIASADSTAEELVAAADAAMYGAKRSGRARFEHFDQQMQRASSTRLRIESELHEALAPNNQLRLFYQPIVRAADGVVVALEALMRWQHPTRGLLPPSEFIPIAEESGLIVPLGIWAVEEACRCARQWHRHGADLPIRISVNLSARQLTQSDLAANVDHLLTAADLDPRRIEFGLELTETAAMEDWEVATKALQALRALGVRLSIDDFGTGYASLAYMKRLAVDTVKIDMSFVRQVAVNSVDRAIVGAVSTLGHSLGVQVVAEGVETEQQAQVLRELKVDLLQGFLYGRPQPVEALVETLSRRDQLFGRVAAHSDVSAQT